MLKMVDRTGIIGVDMVCPLGGAVSPPQPPNYDNIEMEGVGSLVLANSLKAPLERVELIGNSVQGENPAPDNLQEIKSVGRKSRNLFDINYFKEKSNLQMIQCEGFSLLGIICNVKPNTEYTLSANCTEAKYNLNIANKTKRFSLTSAPSRTLVSNDDGTLYIGFYSTTADLINMDDFMQQYKNIQLEEGNKTDYEPYSDKYLLDVKVTGKNLLPKEIVLINNNNNDAETIIYDEENHQYILQMKENNTNQVVFMFYLHLKKGIYTIRRNIIVDGVLTNKKDIVVKNANTNVSLVNKYDGYYSTFEVPEDMKVLINAGDYTGKKNKDAIIYDFQLEMGDKVTDYEPYREPQTLTITSDRPITKWDKLVEQGGEYGWLYSGKIAKEFTFVSKASDENISGRIRRRFKTSLNGKFPQTDKVMCNFLTTDNVRNDYSIGIVGSGDIYIYFYENTGVETLEQANHWLKNLPFEKTIIFERKTTEFVPLSESEQTQLRNLHSYIGTTNIMVDSGEVEAGIKLTYRKEK